MRILFSFTRLLTKKLFSKESATGCAVSSYLLFGIWRPGPNFTGFLISVTAWHCQRGQPFDFISRCPKRAVICGCWIKLFALLPVLTLSSIRFGIRP